MEFEDKIDYDLRTQEYLSLLSEGKSRDEISEKYGLSSWKTLDTHMRRKGYSWNSKSKIYFLQEKKEQLEDPFAPHKVNMIVNLFDRAEADPFAISQVVGMKDHLELAGYMKKKGYEWSSSRKNYVFASGRIEEYGSEPEDAECEFPVDRVQNTKKKVSTDNSLEDYLPLLEMLQRNQNRLIDLLSTSIDGKIPHYGVGGVQKTKSFYMSNNLASLVNSFCESKGVSQKQVLEGALVEYFKKYGYRKEVETLMKRA